MRLAAALVLISSVAQAASGDVNFISAGSPVVLSAGQKTAVRDWLLLEPALSGIAPANLDNLRCSRALSYTVDAQGVRTGTVLSATWTCVACDFATLTDDQVYNADIAGIAVAADDTVTRCVKFTPTQTSAMTSALPPLASPAPASQSLTLLQDVYIARTPGVANHVTATCSPILTKPVDQWRADKRNQKVIATLGRVP